MPNAYGERTFGVLTKIDLTDKGTNAVDYLGMGDVQERWCVVTGGRGFAAKHLVVMLIRYEMFHVRIPVLGPTIKLEPDEEEGTVGKALRSGCAQYVSMDLRDKSQVLKGTKNIIDACVELKVKRLIYSSSPSVVFDGVHVILDGDESLPYPAKVLANKLNENDDTSNLNDGNELHSQPALSSTVMKMSDKEEMDLLNFSREGLLLENGFPQGDRFAWLRDNEFARQALAGVNPVNIELLMEFPIVSKLDPAVYGPPDSELLELLPGILYKSLMD